MALTSRDLSGYLFEMNVQGKMLHEGFAFLGNPKDKEAWKQNIAKPDKQSVDIYLPDFDCAIECKFVTKKVWMSGIEFNYIPRFGRKYTHMIVVTNDTSLFSDKCRFMLLDKGIKLLSVHELIKCLYQLVKGAKKMERVIALLLFNIKRNKSSESLVVLQAIYEGLKERRIAHERLGLVGYPDFVARQYASHSAYHATKQGELYDTESSQLIEGDIDQ